MNEVPVYSERVKLPLFHLFYHVIVSHSMPAMLAHASELFPGARMDLDPTAAGYTCLIKHPTQGDNLVLMIDLSERDIKPPLMRTVAHECTHLSWYILDTLAIGVRPDNHEMQCYIMEEVMDEVLRIIDKVEIGDLDNL